MKHKYHMYVLNIKIYKDYDLLFLESLFLSRRQNLKRTKKCPSLVSGTFYFFLNLRKTVENLNKIKSNKMFRRQRVDIFFLRFRFYLRDKKTRTSVIDKDIIIIKIYLWIRI